MILQSYDFRELSRRHGVTLQIGGSDQWGNIVAGMELTRRTDGKQVFGLTTPLITTASGAKMGKTRAGRGVARPPTGCRPTITGSSGATPKTPMSAASCACSPTCRWRRSLGWKRWAARRSTRRRRCWPPRRPPSRTAGGGRAGRGNRPARVRGRRSRGDVAQRRRAAGELEAGIPAFRLFALAGLAASNGEARRLIRGGGARVNDAPVTDEGAGHLAARPARTARSSCRRGGSSTGWCAPFDAADFHQERHRAWTSNASVKPPRCL